MSLKSFGHNIDNAFDTENPIERPRGRVIEETMEEGANIESMHPTLSPEPELKEPEKVIGDNDFRHVMLDLETWGVSGGALIVAIGAVMFDPAKSFESQTYENFYVRVDPMSAERAGMRIDAATVDWWMDTAQDGARVALRASAPQDFYEVMYGFAAWMAGEAHALGAPYKRTRKVWGNGPAFDLVIMRNAFRLASLECPWTFRDERCFRTIKGLAKGIEWTDMHIKQGNVEIKHQALADATYQANSLLFVAEKLKLNLG